MVVNKGNKRYLLLSREKGYSWVFVVTFLFVQVKLNKMNWHAYQCLICCFWKEESARILQRENFFIFNQWDLIAIKYHKPNSACFWSTIVFLSSWKASTYIADYCSLYLCDNPFLNLSTIFLILSAALWTLSSLFPLLPSLWFNFKNSLAHCWILVNWSCNWSFYPHYNILSPQSNASSLAK